MIPALPTVGAKHIHAVIPSSGTQHRTKLPEESQQNLMKFAVSSTKQGASAKLNVYAGSYQNLGSGVATIDAESPPLKKLL